MIISVTPTEPKNNNVFICMVFVYVIYKFVFNSNVARRYAELR